MISAGDRRSVWDGWRAVHALWRDAMEPVPGHGRACAGAPVRALRRSDRARAAPSGDASWVPRRRAAVAPGRRGAAAGTPAPAGAALSPDPPIVPASAHDRRLRADRGAQRPAAAALVADRDRRRP